MDAAVALGLTAKELGVLAVALLAAAVLLVRAERARAAAMLGALVLTPVLLLGEIWDTPQLQPLRERPALLAALGAVGLVVVGLAAALFARRPAALPLAALAVLPIRLPVELGSESANLLVLLYLILGGGVIAHAVAVFGAPRQPRAGADDDPSRWFETPPAGSPAAEESPPAEAAAGAEETAGEPAPAAEVPPPRGGALEWLLGALVVAYAAQSLYSADFEKALEQVAFFYVPFALLFALLVRVRWSGRLLAQSLGVLVAVAVLFTLIGAFEYATRTTIVDSNVAASNQLESYFRISSAFFDPNIFGRFLVVVMVAVAAVMLWTRERRLLAGAAAVLGLLWIGVVLSLSQSSLAALLAGLAVLAAIRFSVRATAAAILAGLAIAAGALAASPGTFGIERDESLDDATSGRVELIEGGARLFADRPIAGSGSGSFELEFRAAEDVDSERAAAASHTIPLTFAAEQGAIGLALYLGLLVAAFLRLLAGGVRGSLPRSAVVACFTALVAHTMLYAAFLEDPLTWALLALGTALAAARATAPTAELASPAPS